MTVLSPPIYQSFPSYSTITYSTIYNKLLKLYVAGFMRNKFVKNTFENLNLFFREKYSKKIYNFISKNFKTNE